MTDEERKNMLQRLRASAPITKYDAIKAADEIERLAKENDRLKDIGHQMNCDLMENARLAIYDVQTLRDQVRLLWNVVIQLQNQVRQPETGIR